MKTLLEKLDRVAIFFIVYTLIFLTFFKTIGYTLPFVLAFVFAFILQKPTELISKKLRIKNSIASFLTTLLFFAIIILLATLGIVSLTNEAIQLGKNTQTYVTQNAYLIDKYIGILKDSYERLDPTVIDAIKNNISSSILKVSNITAQIITAVVSWLINFLSSVPYIVMVIVFTFLSTYFFTRDMSSAKSKVMHILPSNSTGRAVNIFHESKKMIGSYLSSYTIIICITFLETLIGFSIFKVKYAVILSILSAILDILPVLGVGSVYVPTALIYLASGDRVTGIGILVLYAIVFIARQVLEPKIVSASLDLHPVPILAAIFIGLKINGVAGMFYCMFLVVSYTVLKKVKVL